MQERVIQLEDSLALKHGLVKMRQQRITELEMEIQAKEVALKEAKENLQLSIKAMTDKALTIIEVGVKAIKEFKALDEFKSKIVEGTLVAHEFGFDACKAQVVHFFLGVNVSRFNPYLRIGGGDQPLVEALPEPILHIIELVANESVDVIALIIDAIIDMGV
ncbi:hypothetical protein COCNU_11G003560 [Cocos nucifera]|uniref:Uncharacterized protein n=1 Tax=Cocos nucifera TaxID=13894 RepID=A0A8K0N909_COCNU|nr:hypothetical protein COCNU_11G003560 [Cocos nucifera]